MNRDPSADTSSSTAGPVRSLSLLDSVCIIVGTIIGAGIFKTTPQVASNVSGQSQLMLAWGLGGLTAIIGALCFAELMTRFPKTVGGDYVYLKKAFGRPVGFMFAWAAFWIIRPGNIGAMAMIFAKYFSQLIDAGQAGKFAFALLAVAALSLANLVGVRSGKMTQNVLTIAKVTGIALIILLAVFKSPAGVADSSGDNGPETNVQAPAEVDDQSDSEEEQEQNRNQTNFWLAMVLIMFTYGGWNDIAFVSGEVKKPKINLLRSIILGTVIVTLIYVAINWAFLAMLGFQAMAGSDAVATDFTRAALGAETVWGQRSSQLVAGLICVSCLGAINGMILTSPRIYYSVGRDVEPLGFLARLNQAKDAPWQAIVLQTAITMGLILLCLKYADAFTVILTVTAPYFWGFLATTVLSLLIFRPRKSGDDQNCFRVPLFPILPLFFAGVCAMMVWSSVNHVIAVGYTSVAWIVLGIMVPGIVLGLILGGRRFHTAAPDDEA